MFEDLQSSLKFISSILSSHSNINILSHSIQRVFNSKVPHRYIFIFIKDDNTITWWFSFFTSHHHASYQRSPHPTSSKLSQVLSSLSNQSIKLVGGLSLLFAVGSKPLLGTFDWVDADTTLLGGGGRLSGVTNRGPITSSGCKAEFIRRFRW
jgi:hypothetical protein